MADPVPDRGCVLDASAVLALLFEEPGADAVRTYLPNGSISAVNVAEVLTKLLDHGLPLTEAVRALALLGLQTVPLSEELAHRTAELRLNTRAAGLSLGDRACLALASLRSQDAITADRNWSKVADALGVPVRVVR